MQRIFNSVVWMLYQVSTIRACETLINEHGYQPYALETLRAVIGNMTFLEAPWTCPFVPDGR